MFFNNQKTEELGDMFNMARIGANIMKARKAKGLTQMALADAMGISFQAVSNWERGQSCPDIAKLGELSQLLEVSIDELLGNERAARITRDLAEDRTPDLKAEELVQVAPLLTEKQADRAASGHSLSMMDLMTCAPFVSREFLNRQARNHLETGCTLWELSGLAPFLDQDLLGELALLSWSKDDSLFHISALAPFLKRDVAGVLVQRSLESGQRFNSAELAALAPFLPAGFLENFFEKQM